MKPEVSFFTESRIMDKKGKVIKDWSVSCHGHDTYDSAVTCYEIHKEAFKGNVLELSDVNPILAAVLHVTIEDMKREGQDVEHRIIKVTQTTEILQEEPL